MNIAPTARKILSLDDRFDHESALNISFRSDQFPFVLKNIPAFWWFTRFHPDSHHTTDTAEKINYVKIAKTLRLAYLSGFAFADQAVPSHFVANPGAKAESIHGRNSMVTKRKNPHVEVIDSNALSTARNAHPSHPLFALDVPQAPP